MWVKSFETNPDKALDLTHKRLRGYKVELTYKALLSLRFFNQKKPYFMYS